MYGERDLLPVSAVPHGRFLLVGRVEDVRTLAEKSGDGCDLRSYPGSWGVESFPCILWLRHGAMPNDEIPCHNHPSSFSKT
jgi:hypothetical protein